MNWFDILKEQRQVARNVQSFRPIQLDKPIKLNKPEKNCYEELLEYIHSKFEEVRESFYIKDSYFRKYRGKDIIEGRLFHPDNFEDIQDNVYCLIKQQLDEFITNIDRLDNNAPPHSLTIYGLRFETMKYFYTIQQKKPHQIQFIVSIADTKEKLIEVVSFRDEPEEENS